MLPYTQVLSYLLFCSLFYRQLDLRSIAKQGAHVLFKAFKSATAAPPQAKPETKAGDEKPSDKADNKKSEKSPEKKPKKPLPFRAASWIK